MGLIHLLSLVALICPAAFGQGKEDSLRLFKCTNGVVTQKQWMCDGEDDCGDGSDEKAPECNANLECTEDQFRCRDSKRCIPKSQTCDNEPDCGDKSDEDESICHTTECQPNQFKCSDKHCIPKGWVCDGNHDCPNGLDEAQCNRTCSADEFSCGDGSCIPNSNKCDGDNDCFNGTDEIGCPLKMCELSNEFTCSDGSCVPKRFVCDGSYDCSDRSDEVNCTSEKSQGLQLCHSTEFECSDKKTCIHMSWLCDGESDCPDGGDESSEYCASTCSSGMFQCADKQCIPLAGQCDGVVDCNDGTDEHNCNKFNETRCSVNEVDCGTGLCLPMDKACNGVQECANGADEGPLCGVNECAVKKGGCDHICIDKPIGHHCKCHEGYRLHGNSSCVDINECVETYGSCSQICLNLEGSFSCSCHEGYVVDPEDPTRCKVSGVSASLILTKRNDIRKVLLNGNEQVSIIVNETKVSAALDFNYEAQEIYWSDNDETEPKIYSSDVEGLLNKTITTDVKKVEGLAVDWIHGNLYWTDTGKKIISVSSLDGSKKKTLISENLREPRALVVDPHEGWMFWTDWGSKARIERAGLDGSNRHAIITHTIHWPNGLALDFDQKRIFWVDAKFASIFSSNYDGSARRLVAKSKEFINHPYSVTVFEDSVYWSDWTTQMVYRADKFNGNRLSPLKTNDQRTLHNPMNLQIYHPYRQRPGENHCTALACSHLCLPTPKLPGKQSTAVACACPDGMILTENGHNCAPTSPSVLSTSPSTPALPVHPEQTTSTLPPIYIDFVPQQNPTLVEQAKEINWLVVLVIIMVGSFLTTFVLVSVCACAYKLYLHGNFIMMNFDNPIYHKTPTQDPLCVIDISEPSVPSTPVEEVRQPFCPA